MSNCATFYVDPDAQTCGNSPIDETTDCVECCNCGYIQYESLLPYLKEIRNSLKDTEEESFELEFKLREQIIEISRLFDIDAGVKAGYFSKAHYDTTKILTSNGSKFLRVPRYVSGTLSVRTMGGAYVDPANYRLQDGFLVFYPCEQHSSCGCDNGCGNSRVPTPRPWPATCYGVKARWGAECADMAVQMAIRDYLIEGYRMKDPVVVSAQGFPINRGFKVPHSWSTYINKFNAKRAIYSQFAIA